MAKNEPLISFVVPVYKKAPEIFAKCLKSLRDMSYKKIQIIVAFDGPPESVEMTEIAKRYTTTDNIIEIEHGGAPKARNAGAKLAIGDYISFWDADCYAKPEMAKRWISEFKDTGADFVYSGYEFVGHTDGINGQPFDPYLLTCNNYIATMFPMRREIFPGFDETLKAGQDWDLWLSLTEKGFKGSFIQGYGFSTEAPTTDSISGKGWSDENFRTTHSTVRKKHNIETRDIVIGAWKPEEQVKALHIAKLIGGDCHQAIDFRVHDYRMAMNLGFGPNIFFGGAPNDCVKIQYWMPYDITMLENQGILKVVSMMEKLRKAGTIHWVNDFLSQKRLGRLFDFIGLAVPDIVPLPTDVTEAADKLPNEYRVLLDIDDCYMPIVQTIKQDLPYIQIDELHPQRNPFVNLEEYALFVSLKQYPTVDEPIRRMLINGRNVISNVQAPYTGFLDLEVTMKDFKQELINRIRDGRSLKFNAEAAAYYKEAVDPKKFAEKIKSMVPIKLEVA
jgi:glycosyltransferase involved in cell wall biosynthesis